MVGTCTCSRDVVRYGNGRKSLNAGRGVAFQGPRVVLREAIVSSKWCATGRDDLLLMMMVMVIRSHDSASIHTTILLIISRARTRSSPWRLHGHWVGVKWMEEDRGGRGWGLRRRYVDGSGLRKAPSAGLDVTHKSSAPLGVPEFYPLRRLHRPRLVE